MKIYEEKALDNSGRLRLFNFYDECTYCKEPYKKQKSHAEGAKQEFYCSSTCYNNHVTKLTLVCAHCSKEFTRNRAEVNKRVKNKDIHFCSRECKDLAVHYMDAIRPAHYGTSEEYRAIAFRYLKHICNRCNYSDIRALEVHHIDRNRHNNDISNLEILCANCHTIEHKDALAVMVQAPV